MRGNGSVFKLRLFSRMACAVSSRRLFASRQYSSHQSLDRVCVLFLFLLLNINRCSRHSIMNFEYSKVQEKSTQYWVFQTYELYQEFSSHRFLPGPLLPVQLLARIIRYGIGKIRPSRDVTFETANQRISRLISFESLNMKRALSLV